MIVMLLTEHNFEFLSLKGGCRGSSEPTLIKMPHCWKSHAVAQMQELASGGSKFLPLKKGTQSMRITARFSGLGVCNPLSIRTTCTQLTECFF